MEGGNGGDLVTTAQQELLQRAKEITIGICPDEEKAAVLLMVFATKQFTHQDISGFIPHATYPELEDHLKAVEEKMKSLDTK